MNIVISLREGFSAMDFAQVQSLLAATYWVPGVTRDAVEYAAQHSALVIGAFIPDGTQVGYARVVSDKARFAYLCDVVVAEKYKGQGIGRAMVQRGLEHSEFATVNTWTLATRDAHGVYAPLGFLPVTDPVSRPADWMVLRRSKPAWTQSPSDRKLAQSVHTLYLVNAFTAQPFAGNPAAVCLLDAPREEAWMKNVAREMNLSETAFLYPMEGGYSLRWFTPTVEVKLCGHATLASAHTLWETGVLTSNQPARFKTLSGWLTCQRAGDWTEMDFPALPVVAAEPPAALLEGLCVKPRFVGNAGFKWLVELENEAAVRAVQPDFTRLAQLPVQGIIVTSRAASAEFDFVSRYFAPASGVNEDPVTGSAHCALGPYWQSKLNKTDFAAYQASVRGGVVKVSVRGNRVLLGGQAVTMGQVKFQH